jgi:hypothetical protein
MDHGGETMKKTKPFWIVILIIGALILQPTFAASSFPDTTGHWAETHIEYLVTQNLIGGYPDGTFKPNNTISRAEVAAILANELTLTSQSASFPDVPASHWASGQIGAVVNANIMNGYPDGTFKPNAPMTRAEIASVLAFSYGLTPGSSQNPFSDLGASHWAYSPILALVNHFITTGYPDGTYRPNNSMTRAEFAVFMAKAINPQFVQPAMLMDMAGNLAQIIKDENMNLLATYVHPVTGLRFSPYYYIENTHRVVQAVDVPLFMTDPNIYFWGIQDGSGFDIDLSPMDYYDRYVNYRDFTQPDQVVYNTVVNRGNLINNIQTFYPNAVFVELYVEGTLQYGGMDWRSLYFIFEEYNGDFYLIGIANGEWTT